MLFPEAGKSVDDLVGTVVRAIQKARQRSADRTKRVLVIVAEGAEVSLPEMKERIQTRLGEARAMQVETRVTVLGHVVRGGRPSAFDRLLANRLAHVAVRALMKGQTRMMAAWLLPGELPAEACPPE